MNTVPDNHKTRRTHPWAGHLKDSTVFLPKDDVLMTLI